MPFEELDHYSEKILKLFLKFGSLSIPQLTVLLERSPNNFSGFVHILLDGGYIQNTDPAKPEDKNVYASGTYSPTTKGRIYFDLRFRSRLYAVSKSVFAPIVVSIITTLITLLAKGLL